MARQLAALRPRPPWKPGESGNPAGSKPGAQLSSAVQRYLEQLAPKGGRVANRTMADAMVENIGRIARGEKGRSGDQVAAFRALGDRAEGSKVKLDGVLATGELGKVSTEDLLQAREALVMGLESDGGDGGSPED